MVCIKIIKRSPLWPRETIFLFLFFSKFSQSLHYITRFVNVISSLWALQAAAVKNALPHASESSTGYFIDLRLERASHSLHIRPRAGGDCGGKKADFMGKMKEEESFQDQTVNISGMSLLDTLDWAGWGSPGRWQIKKLQSCQNDQEKKKPHTC